MSTNALNFYRSLLPGEEGSECYSDVDNCKHFKRTNLVVNSFRC
jgi:hypothetical protein